MSRQHAAALVALLVVFMVPVAQAQSYEFFGTQPFDGDRYDGAFLAFTIGTDGVDAVAFGDAVLLDRVPFDVGERGIDGARVVVSGPNATVEGLDVPTGVVTYTAQHATTFRADVADGASAEASDGRVHVTRGVRALVWSPDADVALDDGTVSASLDAGDRVLLRVRPDGSGFPAMSADHEAAISDAVESGRVGAEAFVQGGPQAGHAVATYAPMDVTVAQGDAVELHVGSDVLEDDGRVVVARIGELALAGQGNVEITYDGEAIPEADGIDDVLDPGDDAGQAEHLVTEVGGVHVALVSVPSFSHHVILLQRVAQLVAQNPEVALVTVVAGGLIVALAVAGMFTPRKDRGLMP